MTKAKKLMPVIKWTGSKRSQAETIVSYFPENINTYYEPFLGGGSVMGITNFKKAVCGDICKPLIELWEEIKTKPNDVSKIYEDNWNKLQKIGYTYYYDIRDQFNKNGDPNKFLFLTRTCCNGLIRFNKNGEFNNSFHVTRKGINPKTLNKIINEWSSRIQNVKFIIGDYRETTKTAKKGDLVYLDPPYFYNKDRYSSDLNYEEFLKFLEDLNKREIKYVLSFDGSRGDKNYNIEIPSNLYKRKFTTKAGNSSVNNVLNQKKEMVFESLYLNW